MHILLALVGLLGGIAFWWWRIKMVKEAADDMADTAGRAWGKYKRTKFRRKAEASPIEAVEDPAAAAVIMMLATAKEGGDLSPQSETAAKREITDTMGIADPTELLVFAKWVVSHVEDANNVSLRYSKLWGSSLNLTERLDLVAMVERVAMINGGLSQRQQAIVHKLRERLGLIK
jgi:uncharacterized tellurite resistance protein B-like protein